MTQKTPYGMTKNGPHCINSESGTFGHECRAPATWIGTKANGWQACFCDSCKVNGSDAKDMQTWQPVAEG